MVYTRPVPFPDKAMSLDGWSADGSTALLSIARRHGLKLLRLAARRGLDRDFQRLALLVDAGDFESEAKLDPLLFENALE